MRFKVHDRVFHGLSRRNVRRIGNQDIQLHPGIDQGLQVVPGHEADVCFVKGRILFSHDHRLFRDVGSGHAHPRFLFRNRNGNGAAAGADIGAVQLPGREKPVNPGKDMRAQFLRLRPRDQHIAADQHLIAVEPRIAQHMRHRFLLQDAGHAGIELRFQFRRHFLFIVHVQVIAFLPAQFHQERHDGLGRNIVLFTERLVFSYCCRKGCHTAAFSSFSFSSASFRPAMISSSLPSMMRSSWVMVRPMR